MRSSTAARSPGVMRLQSPRRKAARAAATARSASAAVASATSAIGSPVAGSWTVRVVADGTSCPSISSAGACALSAMDILTLQLCATFPRCGGLRNGHSGACYSRMTDGTYADPRRRPRVARRPARPAGGDRGRRRARSRAALGARDRDGRPQRPAQGRRAGAHHGDRGGRAGARPDALDRVADRAGSGRGRRRARARPGASACRSRWCRRARTADVPLVAFRRSVRFVEITEAVHSAVLNSQFELLRRGEEIHRRFTELILHGRGVPEILAELAAAVGNPVVLEDAGHELVYYVSGRVGRRRRAGGVGRPAPGRGPRRDARGRAAGRRAADGHARGGG